MECVLFINGVLIFKLYSVLKDGTRSAETTITGKSCREAIKTEETAGTQRQ